MTFLRTAIIAALAAAQFHFAALANPAVPTRIADLAIEVEAERLPLIPTEDFAARSAYRAFSMSPDGLHLLAKVANESASALVLIDVENMTVTANVLLPISFQQCRVLFLTAC